MAALLNGWVALPKPMRPAHVSVDPGEAAQGHPGRGDAGRGPGDKPEEPRLAPPDAEPIPDIVETPGPSPTGPVEDVQDVVVGLARLGQAAPLDAATVVTTGDPIAYFKEGAPRHLYVFSKSAEATEPPGVCEPGKPCNFNHFAFSDMNLIGASYSGSEIQVNGPESRVPHNVHSILNLTQNQKPLLVMVGSSEGCDGCVRQLSEVSEFLAKEDVRLLWIETSAQISYVPGSLNKALSGPSSFPQGTVARRDYTNGWALPARIGGGEQPVPPFSYLLSRCGHLLARVIGPLGARSLKLLSETLKRKRERERESRVDACPQVAHIREESVHLGAKDKAKDATARSKQRKRRKRRSRLFRLPIN